MLVILCYLDACFTMHALYFDLCNGFVSDDISALQSQNVRVFALVCKTFFFFFSFLFFNSTIIHLLKPDKIPELSILLIWLTNNDLHGFELIYLQLPKQFGGR